MKGGNDARADGQGRVYQASGDQHITEHHHYAPVWSGPDSVRRPAVGRAPVVLRDRTEEMECLQAAVEPGADNCLYVLHGLGGCGKTAVAYALFHHATTDAGRIGLWVNASDAASLRFGMLAVAADRGATDAELIGARSGLRPAADLVWQYLDRSAEPWLLVLDNADSPAILRDGDWMRTSPAGTVVVTSRQSGTRWWPGAELLKVSVLPRDAAALVLHDLAPHAGTIEEAATVADRLGRLPLALSLAGGFLAHQVIDPWTLADYCRRLDRGVGIDPIELIDQGSAAGSESRHLVSRTWQLSIDVLRSQGLPEASGLLRLLACWAGDPLPLSLLSDADLGIGLPSFRVESALRGLLDQSLTELVPSSVRSLRTHGVLLDSVARTISAEEREQIAASAARMLAAVLPEIPERGPQDPRVTMLAPHVLAFLRRVANWGLGDSAAEAAGECALRLVTTIHRSGDYASALTLAREAAELAAQCLSTDHILVLRFHRRIGRALFRLGRFEESETLHRRVLEDCERVLGTDALDTLDSCLALSKPIWHLGRTRDAVALRQRTAAGRAKLLGNTHPLTLHARMQVVSGARDPDMNELVAAGPDLIADCRRTVGEDAQLTLTAELNYAYILTQVGRPREALPYSRRALSGYERHLGPDYPLTLGIRRTLSTALAAFGRYEEAIAHLEAVIEKRIKILGPDHPWNVEDSELLDEYRRSQNNA